MYIIKNSVVLLITVLLRKVSFGMEVIVKKGKIVLCIICTLFILINVGILYKWVKEKNELSKVAGDVETTINGMNEPSKSGMRITYSEGFFYEPVSDAIKEKITNKSYKQNDIIDYSDLRYITVQYIDFNGQTQQGNLITNVQVADDVLAIFKELYDASYQIDKIKLVDEYDADDDLSMEDNNTSCFNYRTVDGQKNLSDHSYGTAIDINPLYNPYVRQGYGDRNVLPVNGVPYVDRDLSFDHKIVKGDICYNAFIKRGWKWGGEWDSPIDYQHFYKEINK